MDKAHYLGFLEDDHPDAAIYRRQCKAPGSNFSFEVRGGEAEAFGLLDNLRLIRLSVRGRAPRGSDRRPRPGA